MSSTYEILQGWLQNLVFIDLSEVTVVTLHDNNSNAATFRILVFELKLDANTIGR